MFKALFALFAALAALVGSLFAIAVVVAVINFVFEGHVMDGPGTTRPSAAQQQEDALVNNVLNAMQSGDPFAAASARAELNAHRNGSSGFVCEAYDRRSRRSQASGTPFVGGQVLPNRDARNTAGYWHGQNRDAYGNLINSMNGTGRAGVNEKYDRYSDSWQELDLHRRNANQW